MQGQTLRGSVVGRPEGALPGHVTGLVSMAAFPGRFLRAEARPTAGIPFEREADVANPHLAREQPRQQLCVLWWDLDRSRLEGPGNVALDSRQT